MSGLKFKNLTITSVISNTKRNYEQQEMIKEQQAIIKTLEDRITQLEAN